MLSFGGQVALDCGFRLKHNGVLDKYNVKVLGNQLESFHWSEDRKLFNEMITNLNQLVTPSESTYSPQQVHFAVFKSLEVLNI